MKPIHLIATRYPPNGHTTNCDNIRLLKEIPAGRISARMISPSQLRIGNSLQKAANLVTELQRRKVYKVGAAYAVASWLVLQAASIFLPTFDAPPCMMKAVVVFLALGFVLSAILSWMFDITPQGIRRTEDISVNEAVEIVRQLETHSQQEFVRGYLSALLYGKLGDNMKALNFLKHEFLDAQIDRTGTSFDAMLECMRSDPRFEGSLQRPQ